MLLAKRLGISTLKSIFEYFVFRHLRLSKFIRYLSRLRKFLYRHVGITLGVYDHQKYIVAAFESHTIARSDNTFESVGWRTIHLVRDELIKFFDDANYYVVRTLLGAIKGATKKENALKTSKFGISLMDRNFKLWDKRISEWIKRFNEESLREDIIPKKEPEVVYVLGEFKELLAAMKVSKGKKTSERKLVSLFTKKEETLVDDHELLEKEISELGDLLEVIDDHIVKQSAKISEWSRKLHIKQQSSPEVDGMHYMYLAGRRYLIPSILAILSDGDLAILLSDDDQQKKVYELPINEDGIKITFFKFNNVATGMDAHDGYEKLAFLVSLGASFKKDAENQLQLHVPKCAYNKLVKYCATKGVGGAEAKAKAHCRAIVETSLCLLQEDNETSKLDISTENDGISVTGGRSEYSVFFENDTGEAAASLRQFCNPSISEDSFQSCISGGDEGDGERYTGQKNYRKTDCSGYPAYRVRFNGMPWKGYDSLQTYEVEDLFTEQPHVKPIDAYSSSEDGSDRAKLKVFRKHHFTKSIQNFPHKE